MVEAVVEEAIEGYTDEDLPLGSYAVYGLAVQPRATRLVASTFAVKAVSDALQLAYRAAEERR